MNYLDDLGAPLRILKGVLAESASGSGEGGALSGARTKALLLSTEGHRLPPDYPAKASTLSLCLSQQADCAGLSALTVLSTNGRGGHEQA